MEEKEERPNVWSVSVGNLPPLKAVLLTITCVVELDLEGGKLLYRLATRMQ